MWMLASLTFLLFLLVILPILAPRLFKDSKEISNISAYIEYAKWMLPALLGAYGAWIGAGAAYFFGKENLKLSSESTQQALETQRKISATGLEKALIKDINLSPMNPRFLFNMNSSIKEVLKGLDENVDYWFIPVLNASAKKMEDVIHVEAFWRYRVDNPGKLDAPLSDIVKYIEEKHQGKNNKLHNFFLIAEMDDKVGDILKEMQITGNSVGIICDESNNPTHCFSRKDLRSFLIGI